MAKPVFFFTKNDDWFEPSNFYPQGFEDAEGYWPSVEHYFQAQKFPGPENAEYRQQIRTAGSPQHAKTLGRTQKLAIRPDWDQVRDSVMLEALRMKFSHPKLREILLSTKRRELVENSPYDAYWGIGRNGVGKNRLGALLMQVREELSAPD